MHGTIKDGREQQLRVLSWNVLRGRGAQPEETAALVKAHEPDLFLIQEAGEAFETLPAILGGHYIWRSFEGGHDGLGLWSRDPVREIVWLELECPQPRKRRRPRTALIFKVGKWRVANVHLSHGQMLARRQARDIAHACVGPSAVIGDFNIVGPVGIKGWKDDGPTRWTHLGAGFAPFRLDRCLVRDMRCVQATVLDQGSSDHRPILVTLASKTEATTTRRLLDRRDDESGLRRRL